PRSDGRPRPRSRAGSPGAARALPVFRLSASRRARRLLEGATIMRDLGLGFKDELDDVLERAVRAVENGVEVLRAERLAHGRVRALVHLFLERLAPRARRRTNGVRGA